ncbi:MAG TPA: YdeI/OmpD-associated family protein [Puia sp.]|jgi:uncharacterized protein YdeI (YjbR/CyaY-like superfamily)|nr:YdeI/OmpD-associated family protein [Puia sp.]
MNPKVDAFLARAQKWPREMKKLRAIALDCGLTEEIKWGKPCYSFEGKNIVVIQGFKEYCAFLFFKGYLLSDNKGILVKTGENTVVGRQARFTDVKEITKVEPILTTYIYEAIEVERSGVKAAPKKAPPLALPEEFQQKLAALPALKKAFNALTPGRQRAYSFYFSQPKQSATRASRVEKCLQQILHGKGLND